MQTVVFTDIIHRAVLIDRQADSDTVTDSYLQASTFIIYNCRQLLVTVNTRSMLARKRHETDYPQTQRS